MNLRFEKCVPDGCLFVPPSKSMIHRVLIISSFFENRTVVYNYTDCDDTSATAACLNELGVNIQDHVSFYTVKGSGSRINKSRSFNCRQSASTLRFMLPVSLVLGCGGCFSGDKRLIDRISDEELNTFRKNGIVIFRTNGTIFCDGTLQSGEYTVDGSVSSQWVSGLLMSLPFSEGNSIITVKNGLNSKPYVDLTLEVLRSFGINVRNADYQRFYITGGNRIKSKGSDIREITVEGDYSAAAALLSYEVLGGKIELKGLNRNSVQGDRAFSEYLEIMKHGILDVDVSDTPDLVPSVMVCASILNGCRLRGVSRLKFKESDRVAVTMRELSKFGIVCDSVRDTVTVYPGVLKTPAEPVICEKDHRIAMAFAPLLCKTGGVLCGCECVSKSYPAYFDDIKKLGADYTEVIGE